MSNYRNLKDDLLTENLDNDEASDPIGPHNSDNGEPAYLVHEENLPIFIPRPSGNMVRIKCPAAGKLINLYFTNNNINNNSTIINPCFAIYRSHCN